MRTHFLPFTLVASLLAAPAFAASTTGNLTVKAVVQASCYLDTNAGGANAGNAVLDFGTVTNLLADVDADTASSNSAALALICTNGTTYSVSASLGANASGTQRRMIGGTDYLPYDLYSDSGRTTLIGDGTTFATGTGDGTSQEVSIYGRIPANTVLPAVGNYLDTVVLTVAY